MVKFKKDVRDSLQELLFLVGGLACVAGIGIFLVNGENPIIPWEISKWFSFFPAIVVLGIQLYGIMKDKKDIVWREATSVLNLLCVVTTCALFSYLFITYSGFPIYLFITFIAACLVTYMNKSYAAAVIQLGCLVTAVFTGESLRLVFLIVAFLFEFCYFDKERRLDNTFVSVVSILNIIVMAVFPFTQSNLYPVELLIISAIFVLLYKKGILKNNISCFIFNLCAIPFAALYLSLCNQTSYFYTTSSMFIWAGLIAAAGTISIIMTKKACSSTISFGICAFLLTGAILDLLSISSLSIQISTAFFVFGILCLVDGLLSKEWANIITGVVCCVQFTIVALKDIAFTMQYKGLLLAVFGVLILVAAFIFLKKNKRKLDDSDNDNEGTEEENDGIKDASSNVGNSSVLSPSVFVSETKEESIKTEEAKDNIKTIFSEPQESNECTTKIEIKENQGGIVG